MDTPESDLEMQISDKKVWINPIQIGNANIWQKGMDKPDSDLEMQISDKKV